MIVNDEDEIFEIIKDSVDLSVYDALMQIVQAYKDKVAELSDDKQTSENAGEAYAEAMQDTYGD